MTNTQFTVLVLSFLLNSLASQAQVTESDIPSKEWVRGTQKITDAALRVTVLDIRQDSCTNCTSTGELFIIKSIVHRCYFNKKHRSIPDTFTYTTVFPPDYYKQSKDIIVFLRYSKAFRSAQGNLYWFAEDGGQFHYTQKTESYIFK